MIYVFFDGWYWLYLRLSLSLPVSLPLSLSPTVYDEYSAVLVWFTITITVRPTAKRWLPTNNLTALHLELWFRFGMNSNWCLNIQRNNWATNDHIWSFCVVFALPLFFFFLHPREKYSNKYIFIFLVLTPPPFSEVPIETCQHSHLFCSRFHPLNGRLCNWTTFGIFSPIRVKF